MIQEEIIKFNHLNSENDIDIVQNLIYPILYKKTKSNKKYWNEIKSLFLSTMKNAGLNFFIRYIFWFYVNRTIKNGVKKGLPLIQVEEKLRKFIRKRVDDEKDRMLYALECAKRSFGVVKDFIIGEDILDLGAGNGLLAKKIQKELDKNVLLVDILDYNYTDLPLILYNPKEKIPLSNSMVDTTILYTVLHHANNPKLLLKEASRITKSRLIIIEAYIEEDKIRITNGFFDWFYNRVIGDEDIYVPLNFLKVAQWKKVLKANGFDVVKTENLGIIDPIIPEHQIMIIADKI